MPAEASPEVVKKVLFTALHALKDYLSDIVIVGGWVPQIYAWQEEMPEIAVRSNDVDAAVHAKLPLRGSKGVVAAMEDAGFSVETSDAGFVLATFGKKKQPSTRFFYRHARFRVPTLPAFVLAKGLIFVRRPTVEMIERWNSVVGVEDTVYHLGDFALGRASEWPAALRAHPREVEAHRLGVDSI